MNKMKAEQMKNQWQPPKLDSSSEESEEEIEDDVELSRWGHDDHREEWNVAVHLFANNIQKVCCVFSKQGKDVPVINNDT